MRYKLLEFVGNQLGICDRMSFLTATLERLIDLYLR